MDTILGFMADFLQFIDVNAAGFRLKKGHGMSKLHPIMQTDSIDLGFRQPSRGSLGARIQKTSTKSARASTKSVRKVSEKLCRVVRKKSVNGFRETFRTLL